MTIRGLRKLNMGPKRPFKGVTKALKWLMKRRPKKKRKEKMKAQPVRTDAELHLECVATLQNAPVTTVTIIRKGVYHRVVYAGFDATITVACALDLPYTEEGIPADTLQLVKMVSAATPGIVNVEIV